MILADFSAIIVLGILVGLVLSLDFYVRYNLHSKLWCQKLYVRLYDRDSWRRYEELKSLREIGRFNLDLAKDFPPKPTVIKYGDEYYILDKEGVVLDWKLINKDVIKTIDSNKFDYMIK